MLLGLLAAPCCLLLAAAGCWLLAAAGCWLLAAGKKEIKNNKKYENTEKHLEKAGTKTIKNRCAGGVGCAEARAPSCWLLAAGCWLLAAGGEGFDSFLIRNCFTQQETKRGN